MPFDLLCFFTLKGYTISLPFDVLVTCKQTCIYSGHFFFSHTSNISLILLLLINFIAILLHGNISIQSKQCTILLHHIQSCECETHVFFL